MKVIFLDFDGVINIAMWDANGKKCNFNHPADGKVNDFQAICWLNELCKKTDAKIVLTTSWRNIRSLEFLTELLYNSGLKRNIEIIGKTPRICSSDSNARTFEIEQYLKEHESIEKFVILDDEEIIGYLQDFFVKCNCFYGFKEPEFIEALNILNASDTI